MWLKKLAVFIVGQIRYNITKDAYHKGEDIIGNKMEKKSCTHYYINHCHCYDSSRMW